jgi:exosortase A
MVSASASNDALRAWRNACAVVVVLAAVFLLYRPSAESLMRLWSDTDKTTYTHGYLIAALVAWLVIRRRDLLAPIAWSPGIAASLLATVIGFAWLVAVRAGVEIVHQLLLLALLWTSIWALFGKRVALQLWMPIGYLIFAIPAWDQINFLLQGATVEAVGLLLKISSIPAYVDGNFVHLAAGLFEVAGGCSGIHFFIVALALAALYGEVGRDSMKVRIQLLALGALLALLTNWLRVYIIVVAGHLTNMQHYLIREERYNFGWVVFAVMMAVFFLLARRFAPAAPRAIAQRAAVPAIASRGVGLAIAIACVAVVPAWELLRSVAPATLPSAGALLPRVPADWSELPPAPAPVWNPVFTGADRIERAEYANPAGLRVQMFIASYALQRQGRELVAYGNSLVAPGDEVVLSTARAAGGTAREVVVQGAHGRSLIRYYYDIGGRRTDRGIVAQLWYGLMAIRREILSSVVATRASCAADCDAARALLGEFAASTDARANAKVEAMGEASR